MRNFKKYNTGIVSYFVDGQVFYNTKEKIKGEDGKVKTKTLRDGREKAVTYCLNHLLNPKTAIHTMQSNDELHRYQYLLECEKRGEIKDLVEHLPFILIQQFVNARGENVDAYDYTSDFTYIDCKTNKRVVEDVKAKVNDYCITADFKDTKRLFDRVFLSKGLYLRVVIPVKFGWQEVNVFEDKKVTSARNKQYAEEHKQKKIEDHKREMEERKLNREKEAYLTLKNKGFLNSRETKRLYELRARLVAKGILL